MPNAQSAKIIVLDSQVEGLVIDHSITTRRKHIIINELDATVDTALSLQTENENQAQFIEVTSTEIILTNVIFR
jgi:hypothetical protein